MVKAIEAIGERMHRDLPDHATARQLRAEVNAVRLKAEALDRVSRTRSPLETPAAHVVKVANLSRSFDREVTAMLNRAARTWGDGIMDAQRRIDDKVNMKPDAFAGEIRAAFRGLNSKAKVQLVQQLVDQNRGQELAAIVKAPAILTGISEQERESYAKMIYSRHASAEMDELAKLEQFFEAVTAVSRAASTMVKDLTDPVKLAQIERDAAEADAAAAAFTQSLQ
jgi:hypothetical protein